MLVLAMEFSRSDDAHESAGPDEDATQPGRLRRSERSLETEQRRSADPRHPDEVETCDR